MNIVKGHPPNYKEICKAIPGVKGDKNIAFTYGNTMYSLTENIFDDHLLVHERVHMGQQGQIGADVWWSKYLADPEFRLQQELQAYRAQYKFVFKQQDWRYTEALIRSIAADLAGPMYGNMLTYEEARNLITKAKK